MIKAHAYVDKIDTSVDGIVNYRVTCWEKDSNHQTRVYEIEGASDTIAAMEGIRRFVDEEEKRISARKQLERSCPPNSESTYSGDVIAAG